MNQNSNDDDDATDPRSANFVVDALFVLYIFNFSAAKTFERDLKAAKE